MIRIDDNRRALRYFGGRSFVSVDEYCDFLCFDGKRDELRNELLNCLIDCLRRR